MVTERVAVPASFVPVSVRVVDWPGRCTVHTRCGLCDGAAWRALGRFVKWKPDCENDHVAGGWKVEVSASGYSMLVAGEGEEAASTAPAPVTRMSDQEVVSASVADMVIVIGSCVRFTVRVCCLPWPAVAPKSVIVGAFSTSPGIVSCTVSVMLPSSRPASSVFRAVCAAVAGCLV